MLTRALAFSGEFFRGEGKICQYAKSIVMLIILLFWAKFLEGGKVFQGGKGFKGHPSAPICRKRPESYRFSVEVTIFLKSMCFSGKKLATGDLKY